MKRFRTFLLAAGLSLAVHTITVIHRDSPRA